MATRALLAVVLLALALAPSALGSPPRASSSIVGGRDADIADWPSIAFLVAFWNTDSDPDLEAAGQCTGTVIAPEWVISAAHCAFRPDDQPIEALATITGVSDINAAGEIIFADGLVVHPAWDPDLLVGDALLIHLESASSAPPQAVAHPDGEYSSPPGVVNAAGWGLTDEAGTMDTALLQEAWLEIHDDDFCDDFTSHIATQTCAGTMGVAGACMGDSGGPLLVFDDADQPVLYGLTSYGPQIQGEPVCSLQVPDVFSWVPAFTPFICDTIDPCPVVAPTPTPTPTPSPAPPGGGTTVVPTRPLPSAPADATAPTLSRARLSSNVLRIGRKITLSFRLSEAAVVTATVLKKQGRRYRRLSPTLPLAASAGTFRRRFDGRLGGRRLKPGRYKFSLKAIDAAGNPARPVTVAFRIVR